MAFVFGITAVAAVAICIMLAERKGEEWIGGIVAFPSACFYGYATIKLTLLGAPNVLVAAIGILGVVLPTYLYRTFYGTLPIILATFRPKEAEDNRGREVSLALGYGEKLLHRSKEWEGAFRLFNLKPSEKMIEKVEPKPAEKVEPRTTEKVEPRTAEKVEAKSVENGVVKEKRRTKMVDIRPDAMVERGGKSRGLEARKRVESEALRLIQEMKKNREQKTNSKTNIKGDLKADLKTDLKTELKVDLKTDLESGYSYKEMMEQGDLMWNSKTYLLAKKLYEECMNQAKSQEEKRLAELKIERCELEARRESQDE